MGDDEKCIIIDTQDESTFSANDTKRKVLALNGETNIRPKEKGKGIMVSAFLTPRGVLRVPDHKTDEELLTDPDFPRKPENFLRISKRLSVNKCLQEKLFAYLSMAKTPKGIGPVP